MTDFQFLKTLIFSYLIFFLFSINGKDINVKKNIKKISASFLALCHENLDSVKKMVFLN